MKNINKRPKERQDGRREVAEVVAPLFFPEKVVEKKNAPTELKRSVFELQQWISLCFQTISLTFFTTNTSLTRRLLHGHRRRRSPPQVSPPPLFFFFFQTVQPHPRLPRLTWLSRDHLLSQVFYDSISHPFSYLYVFPMKPKNINFGYFLLL